MKRICRNAHPYDVVLGHALRNSKKLGVIAVSFVCEAQTARTCRSSEVPKDLAAEAENEKGTTGEGFEKEDGEREHRGGEGGE